MAATIKDIAKQTGLSLATISKYLNGKPVREYNRVRIEQAIAQLDFHVNAFARSLKTQRSATIGVVVPELNNLFVTSIVPEVEDRLRNAGYAMLVCDCRSNAAREAEIVRFLLSKRVDGILAMPTDASGQSLAPAFEAEIPVVLLDRPVQGAPCDSVLIENVDVARQATRQLLEYGHVRSGIIAGPRDVFTSVQRLAGYRRAFRDRGLSPLPEHIVHGGYTVEGGFQAMKTLLTLPQPPTAVFITNHEMTLGGMIALRELAVPIPEALSVIGFDSIELARACAPKLCVVRQPSEEISAAAAQLLLDRLAGKDTGPARHIRLKAALVAGGSVARRVPEQST